VYLVKWEDFDNSHNSWEPEENLINVKHTYIKMFNQEKKLERRASKANELNSKSGNNNIIDNNNNVNNVNNNSNKNIPSTSIIKNVPGKEIEEKLESNDLSNINKLK